MLAVIDYGAGNLRSVLHALAHLGLHDVHLARTPADLNGADKLILPGVGAFGAGMQQLHAQNLVEPIRAAVAAGTPYLGICLGMQFLFDTSDEMGDHTGLGILAGRVTRFQNRPDLKVPHMGWNRLDVTRPSEIFADLPAPAYAYFVHSFYCIPSDPADVSATVTYGDPFCVAIQRDHIYGVQFHPEKSQQTGLRVLQNYLALPGKVYTA
jgi:imidazole glycerol-phosphate synthase subunit HisH